MAPIHTPESTNDSISQPDNGEPMDVEIQDDETSNEAAVVSSELESSQVEEGAKSDLQGTTDAVMTDDIPVEKETIAALEEVAVNTRAANINDNAAAGETAPTTAVDEPQTKLEKSLRLRDKLDALIRRAAQTKKNCEKLDHDNKYLQEYVGNLMNSGELLNTSRK